MHLHAAHPTNTNCSRKFLLLILLALVLNVSLYLYYAQPASCWTGDGNAEQIGRSVMMKREEREIIRAYLKPTDRMLEYGSGFSTLYFSRFVQSYYSIEHDRQWYQRVQQFIAETPLVARKVKKHVLVAVDPGHRGWPGGFAEGTREQFDEYIRAVHQLDGKKFDVVLIDGRARVECAKEILPYLHANSIVFVHDFTNRPRYFNISSAKYRIVLNTYNDQTLVAFRLAA